MTDQKFNRLTAFAAFLFAFFCISWVALSLFILPVSKAETDYSLLIKSPGWTIISVFGLLSTVFVIFAVFGIYMANREKGGVFLYIGMVLLILGVVFEFASLTWDIFIWPVICANDIYVYFVKDGSFIKTPQFNIFILSMLVLLFSGSILLSIGLMKTKKYGKFIPWLLIAGIVLYLTGNLTVVYIATSGLVIYCTAFVFIGLKFLKS